MFPGREVFGREPWRGGNGGGVHPCVGCALNGAEMFC